MPTDEQLARRFAMTCEDPQAIKRAVIGLSKSSAVRLLEDCWGYDVLCRTTSGGSLKPAPRESVYHQRNCAWLYFRSGLVVEVCW